MKVPLHIVETRRQQLAEYLQQHAYAPLRDVCAHFKTSEATARRDLAVLAAGKKIVRTYGGALCEYSHRFPSFHEREEHNATAKVRIAAAARDLILPNTTCFLDFGTTIYAVAEELRRRPVAFLKIVTNSLPVADLLTSVPGLRVYLLGGELLPRQSALLGPPARKALRFYPLDQALLGAEGANPAGIWNSQSELVSLQQAVLEQSPCNILCLDASKLRHSAPAFLAPWSRFDHVITDAAKAKMKDLPAREVSFV